MSWLIRRFRAWRAGAISGINATENNFKMTGALTAPLIAIWLFIRLFTPDQDYNLYMTFGVFVWLGYIFALYAWAKADANNYIVFPSSKWKFQDGTCRTFDLKVPPDSWEKIQEFPDGSVGYKVYFADKYLYPDPDLPFPVIFDWAYWTLRALWDKSFQRRAVGEFFHKGIYVTKPDCEDISVYVVGWEIVKGQRIPVCVINDCALTYQEAVAQAEVPLEMFQGTSLKGLYTLFRDARKREDKLLQHDSYLEDRLDIAEKDSSKDFKKSADERMKGVRGRHGRIMDVREPLLSRIFNAKTIAIAILFIFGVFVVGRVIFHWW